MIDEYNFVTSSAFNNRREDYDVELAKFFFSTQFRVWVKNNGEKKNNNMLLLGIDPRVTLRLCLIIQMEEIKDWLKRKNSFKDFLNNNLELLNWRSCYSKETADLYGLTYEEAIYFFGKYLKELYEKNKFFKEQVDIQVEATEEDEKVLIAQERIQSIARNVDLSNTGLSQELAKKILYFLTRKIGGYVFGPDMIQRLLKPNIFIELIANTIKKNEDLVDNYMLLNKFGSDLLCFEEPASFLKKPELDKIIVGKSIKDNAFKDIEYEVGIKNINILDKETREEMRKEHFARVLFFSGILTVIPNNKNNQLKLSWVNETAKKLYSKLQNLKLEIVGKIINVIKNSMTNEEKANNALTLLTYAAESYEDHITEREFNLRIHADFLNFLRKFGVDSRIKLECQYSFSLPHPHSARVREGRDLVFEVLNNFSEDDSLSYTTQEKWRNAIYIWNKMKNYLWCLNNNPKPDVVDKVHSFSYNIKKSFEELCRAAGFNMIIEDEETLLSINANIDDFNENFKSFVTFLLKTKIKIKCIDLVLIFEQDICYLIELKYMHLSQINFKKDLKTLIPEGAKASLCQNAEQIFFYWTCVKNGAFSEYKKVEIILGIIVKDYRHCSPDIPLKLTLWKIILPNIRKDFSFKEFREFIRLKKVKSEIEFRASGSAVTTRY